ncbi:MAG: hypothetical protein K8T90_09945 [Planctomycetes bacterium]|nr:hypothetical protein [Planctomycetota bacterium]
MNGITDPDTTLLTATNIALGIVCLTCALAVLGGVLWENVARRVLRATLPDCWPPVPDEPDTSSSRKHC